MKISSLPGVSIQTPGINFDKLLNFTRHEEKDRINRQKHGISFETASYVFRDEYYIEMYDFEHSMEEDRYIAIGMVGDLLFVVFTERGKISG